MQKHTEEQLREAIVRLTMCARRNCKICRYKDRETSELPSEECKNRITRNMSILADECLMKDAEM